MSTHRPDRLDGQPAQQQLRGQPAGSAGEKDHLADVLADVLAAAAPPADEGELAGEQTAVAAFRAAHLAPPLQVRRRSMIKTTVAKLLTAKIGAAVAAATIVGGVATAAATGTLPAGLGGSTAGSSSPSTTSTHDQAADHGSSPSPSLVGLCHAYSAGEKSEHGKALDSPAFTALIKAAGGKDQVPGYCAHLLSTHPDADSTTAHNDEANEHGSAQPNGHGGDDPERNGQPATHPTGESHGHPSGPPTSRPNH
jgi:hypothetical protein